MLYFITGGQRSGKSGFAQQLASGLSAEPVYLATAKIWDQEFARRVDRHRKDRDQSWTTIEEEMFISRHPLPGRVVVLDCITLWLSNFMQQKQDVDEILDIARQEFEAFVKEPKTVLVISNEIGMGLHANTELGRKFTDLQGWMNQYIANRADKVIFMVSGLPLTIKNN